MEEQAKAVQEVAKAAQKSIHAAEKLGGFLSKILGEGFSHLGSTFADWAAVYRYKNLLKLIDSVEQIHRARHLEGKTIPILPKHAIPILQQASLEDSDEVQNIWAGLLANATDPNVRFQLRKLYIEILSALDPIDAIVLNYLGSGDLDERYNFMSGAKLNAEEIAKQIERDESEVKISLSNLFRLGLIIDAWEQTLESLDRGYAGFRVNNPGSNFRLSHLGRTLIVGCKAT